MEARDYTQRIAVARLRLADGQQLLQQVIELNNNKVVRHYPLTEELEHTSWYNVEFILLPDNTLLKRQ